MHDIKKFNKNYGKWFISDILRAIKRYSLIKDKDHICIALSGGKDSFFLLFALYYINSFTHFNFKISALHIKTANYKTDQLQQICSFLGISYIEDKINFNDKNIVDKNICYICSRLKRGAISESLKKHGIKKVAYAHHADDVAETFFMNMVYNKKLGSFSPKVTYKDNPMIIIRPMIYLEEKKIISIHKYLGLPKLDFQCPYQQYNIRNQFKKNIKQLDLIFQTTNFSKKVVGALENIDFTNIWKNLE